MEQELRCEPCRAFLAIVKGLRGPDWRERERRGLRHSVVPVTGKPYRGGSVATSPALHRLLSDTSQHMIQHLKAVASRRSWREHVRPLPAWVRDALDGVTVAGAVGRERDAASQVAARLLGISGRAFYLHRGEPIAHPTAEPVPDVTGGATCVVPECERPRAGLVEGEQGNVTAGSRCVAHYRAWVVTGAD